MLALFNLNGMGFFFCQIIFYLITIGMIISQCGIHLSQGKVGNFTRDFIWPHA